MKKVAERALQIRGPTPPILMGAQRPAARSRADMALRVLLRLVALIWLAEGVHLWTGVLTGPSMTYLPAASPLHIAGLFFFCILDFVAAVGLWLVASWGVAVWLATIVGHVLALALAPGVLAGPLVLCGADIVLATVYAALAWTVARERRLA